MEDYDGKEAEGKDVDEKAESGPVVRAPPRRGRRERKEEKEEEDESADATGAASLTTDPAPRPGRRRRPQDEGGWMSSEPEAKPRLSLDRIEDVADSVTYCYSFHSCDELW